MADDVHQEEESRHAAREVLIEVVREPPLLEEYSLVVRSMSDGWLGDLVDVAWRHQFDPNRHAYKRAIRELQVYICKHIQDAIEHNDT